MSVQWQGYFTALNRAMNALGGVPPTPTSTPVLSAAYKGVWNGITTYFPGDEVSYNGDFFRATQESLNVVPPNSSYWLLFTVNTPGIIANAATALAYTVDDTTQTINANSSPLSSLYSYALAVPYVPSPVLTFTAPQSATLIATLMTNCYFTLTGSGLTASAWAAMVVLDTTAGSEILVSPDSGAGHGYFNIDFKNGVFPSPTQQMAFQDQVSVTAGHVYKMYLVGNPNGSGSNVVNANFTSTQMQLENIQR